MTRIIIDARESGTSTGRYIDKLIEHLHKLSPSESIGILTKPHRVIFFKTIAPQFDVIETTFKEFSFSEQFGLKTQLDGLKADLIHFGMVQQPIRYRGACVTTIHDLTTLRFINPAKHRASFMAKQQIYRHVIKRAVYKSSYILTISEYVKNDLIQLTGAAKEKIIVTYEAADPITDPPAPLAILLNTSFILYIGRPTPHKNLPRLIAAFETVQSNKPELKLVLAGKKDANYAALEQSLASPLKGSVIFTDYITDGQLRWLYEHCAAYIFPSLSEGFGLPGLEAMIHGAPVLSSNATCLPEIYGNAAEYFDPYDIGAMTSAVETVLDSPARRQQLITVGQKQASHYSWDQTAEQTLAVYRRALQETA